jgi:hypothetical protein
MKQRDHIDISTGDIVDVVHLAWAHPGAHM